MSKKDDKNPSLMFGKPAPRPSFLPSPPDAPLQADAVAQDALYIERFHIARSVEDALQGKYIFKDPETSFQGAMDRAMDIPGSLVYRFFRTDCAAISERVWQHPDAVLPKVQQCYGLPPVGVTAVMRKNDAEMEAWLSDAERESSLPREAFAPEKDPRKTATSMTHDREVREAVQLLMKAPPSQGGFSASRLSDDTTSPQSTDTVDSSFKGMPEGSLMDRHRKWQGNASRETQLHISYAQRGVDHPPQHLIHHMRQQDNADRARMGLPPRHLMAEPFLCETNRVFLKSMTEAYKPDEAATLSRYISILNEPLPLAQWLNDLRWATTLRQEFPWMREIIDHLERRHRMALYLREDGEEKRYESAMRLHFEPLLIHGDPGIGKSRFVKRLGELLDAPALLLSLAGSAENMVLKGLARGWSSSRPGRIVELVMQVGCPNPIVMLDEIDKVSASTHNGNVHHTLLNFLEPSTATNVQDDFLLGEVDYSAVNWIATANILEAIPDVLKSRFTCLRAGMPGPEDLPVIIVHQLQDMAEEYGVPVDLLPPMREAEMLWLQEQMEEKGISLRAVSRLIRRMLESRVGMARGPMVH
jgi:hypothetical protein